MKVETARIMVTVGCITRLFEVPVGILSLAEMSERTITIARGGEVPRRDIKMYAATEDDAVNHVIDKITADSCTGCRN